MEITEHINALEREGQLLVRAARTSGLDAPVPTCPGWLTRDLLAHVRYVHRWATAYVAEAITDMVREDDEAELLADIADDDDLVDDVREGHAALVRALSNAPSDLECWTFLPAPSPLAMWARRQAHETAIHRIDAELAAKIDLSPLDPRFAADGVDELVYGFVGRRNRGRPMSHDDQTIRFEATDRQESWHVRFTSDSIETAADDADGSDLRVRAGAADLYLLLWNRPPRTPPETSGDVELLDLWRERVRIKWS